MDIEINVKVKIKDLCDREDLEVTGMSVRDFVKVLLASKGFDSFEILEMKEIEGDRNE